MDTLIKISETEMGVVIPEQVVPVSKDELVEKLLTKEAELANNLKVIENCQTAVTSLATEIDSLKSQIAQADALGIKTEKEKASEISAIKDQETIDKNALTDADYKASQVV